MDALGSILAVLCPVLLTILDPHLQGALLQSTVVLSLLNYKVNVLSQRASQVVLVVKTHLPIQKTKEKHIQSLGAEDPPGGGHCNPLQYSCLENSKGREAWQTPVHIVTESNRVRQT